MAAAGMTIEQFVRELERVVERQPLAREKSLRKAAEIVRDDAKDLIGQEYAGWPELAESTIEEKQRLGYTGKVSSTDPLLRTGEYRASIQVGDVTPEHAFTGTDDPIAPYQEFGTGRIPARPAIGAAIFRKKEAIEEAIGHSLIANLRGSFDG